MQLSGGLVPGVRVTSDAGTDHVSQCHTPVPVSEMYGQRESAWPNDTAMPYVVRKVAGNRAAVAWESEGGDQSALLIGLTFIVRAGVMTEHNTYRGYILGIINRHFLDFLSVKYSANTSVRTM